MKKTLMALAVGAAFAAPSAFADVTISGSINMGIAYEHSGSGSTGATNSITSSTPAPANGSNTLTGLTANYSNITISSTDDIGNGMKLDFAYQITAPTVTNSGVSNRNSHIGVVSDSWGGVWYGTNENIYERYLYTIDPLDGAAGIGGNLSILATPGYGQVFTAPSGNPTGQTADFYNRTENTVWYDSPSFNGLTFGGAYQLPAYKTATSPLNPTLLSLGVKYASPAIPLTVWLGYETRNDYDGLSVIRPANTAASSTTDTAGQIGVSYTLGDILLFGLYEQLKYKADFVAPVTADVSEYKRAAFALGLKWNLSTGYFGAQYIQAENATCQSAAGCNANGTGAKMVSAGYYHTLTKQSQAYIVAMWLKNDDLARYGIAGGLGTPSSAPGAQNTALTVGLKHSF